MSTANIYTKEKVDELLDEVDGKFFVLPSNVTINTNGITIGGTTIGSGTTTTDTSTIKTKLVMSGRIEGDLMPVSDNKYSLGGNLTGWNKLYVNQVGTIGSPVATLYGTTINFTTLSPTGTSYIGGGSNKLDFIYVNSVGSSSNPVQYIYSQNFAYKTSSTGGSTYPLPHLAGCKKYTSYASSMVTTNTTLYIGNSYWNYKHTLLGSYQDLKICTGTFVKAGGDNARKTISFPISFTNAPLVFLQMGGGNSPGSVQYRNGELIVEITTSGFTTASSCSEQSRMCYFAIGW